MCASWILAAALPGIVAALPRGLARSGCAGATRAAPPGLFSHGDGGLADFDSVRYRYGIAVP